MHTYMLYHVMCVVPVAFRPRGTFEPDAAATAAAAPGPVVVCTCMYVYICLYVNMHIQISYMYIEQKSDVYTTQVIVYICMHNVQGIVHTPTAPQLCWLLCLQTKCRPSHLHGVHLLSKDWATCTHHYLTGGYIHVGHKFVHKIPHKNAHKN